MITITHKIKKIYVTLARMAQIIKKTLPCFDKYNDYKIVDIILAEIAQLNKRNGVSCFPFSQTQKLIRSSTATKGSFIVSCVVLSLLFAHPVLAATVIIQEEAYVFPSDTARYVSAITFMIEPATAADTQACGRPYINKCIKLPVAHFQLGSSRLSASEKDSILAGLHRCDISKTTSLHVTGYTCPLGSEKANALLSLSRAHVVAGFLRKAGYSVEDKDIQGKGQESLVTNIPDKFAMNRRVEISNN